LLLSLVLVADPRRGDLQKKVPAVISRELAEMTM
jgi:hypothetical protein